MDLHGLSWTCMDYHGLAWTIMDLHGLSWTNATSRISVRYALLWDICLLAYVICIKRSNERTKNTYTQHLYILYASLRLCYQYIYILLIFAALSVFLGGRSARLLGLRMQKHTLLAAPHAMRATQSLTDALTIYGLSWTCMDYHGLAWTIMDLHGLSWTCMDYHGLAWTIMD